jgi:hypothetical protein
MQVNNTVISIKGIGFENSVLQTPLLSEIQVSNPPKRKYPRLGKEIQGLRICHPGNAKDPHNESKRWGRG